MRAARRARLYVIYQRYAARLAEVAADRLAEIGADPAADADDVLQTAWLAATESVSLPAPDHAWSALVALLDRAITTLEASRRREFAAGMALPAARGLPPAPLEPLPSSVASIATAA
ncbi:hypothetical protein GCM10010232_65860 [Streptomyces amakusaensis]|uniref:Uncharacterized protein n=1 Tax=Streptomyces amakusaensis TaxID=67271 RepID=A0ABW0ARE4_9ACTN